LDETIAATLPDENPCKGLSNIDLFARCASDKLFEMNCHVRRAKKERLVKIEEEASAARVKEGAAPEDAAQIEAAAMAASHDYDLDAIFYMMDYP
jgi:hypothetical protein